MTPPIYIITLASAAQRRAFQQEQAERLGFEPVWHPAVGVDDMSDAFFFQHAFSWQRPLKKTEVGCFMSHYQLWQRIAQSDGPAVVLEDDVILGGNWDEHIKLLCRHAKADFVCLEAWGKKLLGQQQVIGHIKLQKLLLNSAGAAAYVLWPSGAQRLVDRYQMNGAALTDAFINQTQGWSAWQLVPANVVQMNVAQEYGLVAPVDSGSLIAREIHASATTGNLAILWTMKWRRLVGELNKLRVNLLYRWRYQRAFVPYMNHDHR